jgi:hypothetical protein
LTEYRIKSPCASVRPIRVWEEELLLEPDPPQPMTIRDISIRKYKKILVEIILLGIISSLFNEVFQVMTGNF